MIQEHIEILVKVVKNTRAENKKNEGPTNIKKRNNTKCMLLGDS